MEIILASAVFLVIGYFYGFYTRSLWDRLNRVKKRITARPKTAEPPKGTGIIEGPLSQAEVIEREQEELLERLNPTP